MDYVICLCYSSEKGFYTKYSSSPCGEDEVIFRSHERKQLKYRKITIPEACAEIEIERGSHFNLLATLSKNGAPILDFSTERIYILNQDDVQTFVSRPYDWTGLFKQIIDAFANFNNEKYFTAAKCYVDELSKIAQMQSIIVKSYLYSDRSSQWNEKELILLVMSDRINNLLTQLMLAKVDREDLLTECVSLCQQYLEAVTKNYPLFGQSDSRESRVEDALMVVHQFLHRQKSSNVLWEIMMAHQLKETEECTKKTRSWFER